MRITKDPNLGAPTHFPGVSTGDLDLGIRTGVKFVNGMLAVNVYGGKRENELKTA